MPVLKLQCDLINAVTYNVFHVAYNCTDYGELAKKKCLQPSICWQLTLLNVIICTNKHAVTCLH